MSNLIKRNDRGRFIKGTSNPWNKGIKMSKDFCEKQRIGFLGINNPNFGKKFSEEHRNKLSKAHIGKTPWNRGVVGYKLSTKNVVRRFGMDNPSWKGGITPLNHKIRTSKEYEQWAKTIKERDNFECQICGAKGVFLHSNHIKKFVDYPELRFELTNGITICRNCDNHWIKYHEEEWESYFNFNLAVRGII